MDQLDLHAVVDGELAPEELASANRLIAEDPKLQQQVESLRSLKACLNQKTEKPECASLWKDCVGRLNEIDKVRRAEFVVGKYSWALCAVFAFVILGAGYFGRLHSSTVRTGEVASMASSLIPIASPKAAAPEDMKTWINEKIGYRPQMAIDSSMVTSSRYSESGDRRMVCLGLRDQDEELALMVFNGVSRVEGVEPMGGGMFAGRLERMNCVIWSDHGNVVLLAGNRAHEYLRAYAARLYR